MIAPQKFYIASIFFLCACVRSLTTFSDFFASWLCGEGFEVKEKMSSEVDGQKLSKKYYSMQ